MRQFWYIAFSPLILAAMVCVGLAVSIALYTYLMYQLLWGEWDEAINE